MFDPLDQLRVIVDAMAAPVMRCSRDLRYLWVSSPYAAWLGRSPADIVDRPIVDVIGKEAFEAIKPHIDRVLAGHRVEYEEPINFLGRGTRWIRATYAPTVDDNGVVDGWVAVVLDVDERRRTEEALRSSHAALQQLAAIVTSSEDAIIGIDLTGIIRSWNAGAERMYGYSSAEAIGKPIRILIPEDRERDEQNVLDQVRRGNSVNHYETTRRRKDGSIVPISLTVSPIRDEKGEVIGASKIARDISERRQIEEAARRASEKATFLAEVSAALGSSRDVEQTLQTVVNLAVPAIADWCVADILNEDGAIVHLAMAHVDPDKLELGRIIRERYDSPESPNSPQNVIRTGRSILISHVTDEMIVAAARRDEERIRLVRMLNLRSYLCVPMKAAGQTVGALTLASSQEGRAYTAEDVRFAEDVATRAAMAIQNAQAYQELSKANRLKDEFLATLSHELRTPLNAVLGYARILRTGSVSGDGVQRALDVMERNASALTQIVEDVLDVARITSGKTRLHVQSVDLQDVVNNAIETIMPAADAKGVRIQAVMDSNAGPISGDPDRLQQIVWNLLTNAVKFTPRGGRVQARVERINSHVEVVVSDTGIGIKPEFLPHIFERFRQAEGGTTRRHGGLGLGLAIARHLVEMHGGTIQASSDGEGKGATFRIKLPLMIIHTDSRPDERRVHPRARRVSPVAATSDLQGIHVLAVDDDVDALGLMQEIFESAGARVTTAGNPLEALRTLQTERPDVLIADLGMPAIDGFDFIRRVRQSPDPYTRAIPAAALTAYARSEDRVKALRSGFQMHLAKPVDPAELIAAVAALVRRETADR